MNYGYCQAFLKFFISPLYSSYSALLSYSIIKSSQRAENFWVKARSNKHKNLAYKGRQRSLQTTESPLSFHGLTRDIFSIQTNLAFDNAALQTPTSSLPRKSRTSYRPIIIYQSPPRAAMVHSGREIQGSQAAGRSQDAAQLHLLG
jgi:hypothetical protein